MFEKGIVTSANVQRLGWILLGMLVLMILRPALPYIGAALSVTLAPAVVVSGLVYARGGTHAFCLGAAAAGGGPFLYVAAATLLDPLVFRTVWNPMASGYTPALCVLIAGAVGGTAANFFYRRRDRWFRRTET